MGTTVGTRLTQAVNRAILTSVHQVIFWCDSMNVLWWIKGCSRTCKPFVAKRIGEIPSVSSPDQWRYVPTELNPADYLTRGLGLSDLTDKKSWWEGPCFLHSTEED